MTCLNVSLLRVCQVFSVSCKAVHRWVTTNCCFMSDTCSKQSLSFLCNLPAKTGGPTQAIKAKALLLIKVLYHGSVSSQLGCIFAWPGLEAGHSLLVDSTLHLSSDTRYGRQISCCQGDATVNTVSSTSRYCRRWKTVLTLKRSQPAGLDNTMTLADIGGNCYQTQLTSAWRLPTGSTVR
jgi:hypothetical protein